MGDIIKVIVQAFFTVGRAVTKASLAVVGAVESMRLARGLKVNGQAATHAAQIARVISKLMSKLATFELEAEKLLQLAERTWRTSVGEQLKATLEAAGGDNQGAPLLLASLEAARKGVAAEVDTGPAHYQSQSLKATKGAKKGGGKPRGKSEEAEGLADGLGMLWAARAKRKSSGTAVRVAPAAEPSSPPPAPPPSPPPSPPLLGADAGDLTLSKSARRGSSSGEIVTASLRKLSRQVSAGSLAMLNGYDPEQTYAAGVSEAEAAAAAAAAEGERLQPPAEAAHTAAQAELVSQKLQPL